MTAGTDMQALFGRPDIPQRNRVLVLGIGGAGCNMTARMASRWPDGGPDVAVVHTDPQVLAACPVGRSVLMGEQTTQRLSTGADPAAGRMAAEESLDHLDALLDGYDLVFLVCGVGGGTGTGAAPVIAARARTLGALTLCFASMPFSFEGDRRHRTATEGLRVLQEDCDAVVMLPNDKLLDLLEPQAGLESSFRLSDEHVASCIHTLWTLLTRPGVINLDFADLRKLVEKSGGVCSFGHGTGEGKARSAEALRSLLACPWLDQGALLGQAAAVMVNLLGGPDMTLADVQGVVGEITTKMPDGAHLFVGAAVDPHWRNRMAITVLTAEAWVEPLREDEETEAIMGDYLADQAAAAGAVPPPGASPVQADLPLDTADKRGRFTNSEPTIINGQDLDIPTFLRRGLKLSFQH